MSSDIVLSPGVRQILLSLQNTAALMSTTQNRLATGKKVNTALDNPNSFFTSQSLQSRAGDLNELLDWIGQAQKTLEAANQGITSLTKLVQSAQSIVKQARQSAGPDDRLFRDRPGLHRPGRELGNVYRGRRHLPRGDRRHHQFLGYRQRHSP